MSLTLALSKGKLLAGTEALLRRARLPFPGADGRRLVARADGFRFLFVKDMDVPTYVEYGVADCGIAGRDVLLETGADVLEPLDLGFGRCRLVVAAPRGAGFDYRRASTIRIATKYPRVATAHFLQRGVSAEVVRVHGSVELAPGLGLADGIVDVVETGRTLDENGLVPIETVAESTARLVVNRASQHARREALQLLLGALRRAVTEGVEATR
ncbi:MAG TPA: ATP phosphoribosyltransferase [Vicinamibacteria bacterium]|nr:ATP phosphoribosyltransferase [Vicinamibacteria bacterium]